jgi:hypothetical protein
MYPSSRTAFIESLRGETEAASHLESSHAPKPQSPEQVAEAILGVIRTGAEQADLVRGQLDGSYRGGGQPNRHADPRLSTDQHDWRPNLRRRSHS